MKNFLEIIKLVLLIAVLIILFSFLWYGGEINLTIGTEEFNFSMEPINKLINIKL